ncbi:hypothetical protein SAMN05421820_107122 [Pedobacter steynii]|uniref:Immunity protein 26 n=1 Tax=Pedobacter steynii TaxID=430522 RepID=A0A1H0AJR0_9SPHI|nr:hypothetical protein [Pedobacter steynii]NQX41336.1 hypothetical protein [Pedobacter steynii]SDN33808.1 hypothetical protein SAMN05421820_107122 [Pedobacter steynii]
MQNDIAASDIKKGDLFYVELNERFFFMQVIHITTDLPAPYNQAHKFGYFVVVFEKTYKTLPVEIEALELSKVYVTRYLWKKTALYVSMWNSEPNIGFTDELMHYDYKDRYKLQFFANTKVSEPFNPPLIYDFVLPAVSTENEDEITVSHQPLSLQMLLWALLEEEKKRNAKRKNITPLYFNSWKEEVEPDHILKAEKVITALQLNANPKGLDKALKKAVVALNKLDEKLGFIGTMEAEDLYECLLAIAVNAGLEEERALEIIESTRDW